MVRKEKMNYTCAITFGRFNIPHTGHVRLIQQMLQHAQYADVHVSGAGKNTDYYTRVLLFKHLCRRANIDMSRVSFYNSPTVAEAMTFSIDMAGDPCDCVLVLGTDQATMGHSISRAYYTDFVVNQRTTSSTEVRYFIDASQHGYGKALLAAYGSDKYSARLATILRQEEQSREQSAEVTRKVAV